MKTFNRFCLLLAIAAVIPFLVACDNEEAAHFGVSQQGDSSIELYDSVQETYYQRTVLKIDAAPGFAGTVIEVEQDGVQLAVEYFDMKAKDWKFALDSQGCKNIESRRLLIYPATAEGVIIDDKGFCYLPENEDGTFTTDPDSDLNFGRVPTPVMAGKIVRSDRSKAIEVTIKPNREFVVVSINGKVHETKVK
jgi:hypothetical protein